MSSRRLREKKIREEAIAHDHAVKRLKGQLDAKMDSFRRTMPDLPKEIAQKVSLMLIDAENKGGRSMQPLRNILDPSPDRPQIVPQATKKKKTMTTEEFEEWFKNQMGKFSK